jgi:heme/copper-type cytochrome/quinol oxidase subunit 3
LELKALTVDQNLIPLIYVISEIFLFVVFVGKILIRKLATVIKMLLEEYMSKKFTIAIIANVGLLLSGLIAEVGASPPTEEF